MKGSPDGWLQHLGYSMRLQAEKIWSIGDKKEEETELRKQEKRESERLIARMRQAGAYNLADGQRKYEEIR